MKSRGFGLIQAMMIMLLVSGMMLGVLKYASISAKHTQDTYVREQAELFLSSSIEKTLLAISAYDRNTTNGCISFVNDTKTKRGVSYNADVNITKYYLLAGSDDAGYCGSLTKEITSEETHGMVMLEVTVTATMDDNKTIRLIRGTLQRP